ncbi:MAG: ParB/RepB/Spo0J family partition protein [Candidatus Goldiibacteriota bacterium]
MARKALGRGLDSLIPGAKNSRNNSDRGLRELSIKDIKPNMTQPRKNFNPEKLDELIQSIKENGIIEPVIVKQSGEKFEIIAGERRFKAAQKAGLRTIPVVIKNVSPIKQFEMALIENIQREDLNPLEEGLAYKQLMEAYRLTQEQLAVKLGKNRSTIANTVRILDLPKQVQKLLIEGKIQMGHAKILLSVRDLSRCKALAERAARKEMTVKELEEAAKNSGAGTKPQEKSVSGGPGGKSTEIKNIIKEMKFKFGTKVDIRGDYNKGKIEIEYYNKEDLERILEALNIKP